MRDRKRQITGITGIAKSRGEHANRTSFKQGRSGNPKGRPKGSGRFGPVKLRAGKFRAGTRAAAALLDARAEELAQHALEMALAGDAVAVRFCLGRLLGARRGQPVELKLPAVAEPGDLAGAVTAVVAGLADGRITPDEALACAGMLDGLPRVLAAGRPLPGEGADLAEDAREALRRKLNRLAGSQLLAQSEALRGIGTTAGELDAVTSGEVG